MQGPAVTTTAQQSAGYAVPLDSLVSVQNSSSDISAAYAGSVGTLNGSMKVPFTLSIYRSGANATANLNVNSTSSLTMWKFGNLYYDCSVVGENETCYNATADVAGAAASLSSILSSYGVEGNLLGSIENSTGQYNITAYPRAVNGTPCTYLSLFVGTTTLGECTSNALGLALNLTIINTNSTASLLYQVALSRTGSRLLSATGMVRRPHPRYRRSARTPTSLRWLTWTSLHSISR